MAQEVYVVTMSGYSEDGFGDYSGLPIGLFQTEELALESISKYIEYKRREAEENCDSEDAIAKIRNFTYNIQDVFSSGGICITDIYEDAYLRDTYIECSTKKLYDKVPDVEELRP